MKLKIEISLQNYDRMLQKCDNSSKEYGILVNGSLIQRPSGNYFERLARIICNTNDATKLLALADRICPEAAQEIEKSVDFFPKR
jgi:hypothetical protein